MKHRAFVTELAVVTMTRRVLPRPESVPTRAERIYLDTLARLRHQERDLVEIRSGVADCVYLRLEPQDLVAAVERHPPLVIAVPKDLATIILDFSTFPRRVEKVQHRMAPRQRHVPVMTWWTPEFSGDPEPIPVQEA